MWQGVERWAFSEEGSCRVRGVTACSGAPHMTLQWQMMEGASRRSRRLGAVQVAPGATPPGSACWRTRRLERCAKA